MMAALSRGFGVLIATWGFAAFSQYPTGPIKMMVPFSAGGPTDTVARLTARAMSKTIGETVVVENRASAGGVVGVELVARAKPDGYTILMFHIGMATTPWLYQSLRYKPLEDFEYIGLVNDVPMTVISGAALPASSFRELVAHVKANKQKVTYAHAGVGSASHLCGTLLMQALGIEVLTVPYKGTGPALTDLLGGRVDFMCDQTTNTSAHIKARSVKVYGVTSPSRLSLLPEVPTMAEQGYKDLNFGVWHALYAPKGTPKPRIDKLVSALQAALRDPELRTRFEELGAEVTPPEKATPEVLERHLKSELSRWRPVLSVKSTAD
jgi:tripartite-type tricarboxylate transporter receptor subunit TctC